MSWPRAHVLMYHGIHEDADTLGRAHAGRSYNVSLAAFRAQMRAIAQNLHVAPSVLPQLDHPPLRERSWAVTFDDGLDSVLPAAETLDSQGWRAHFFIVSEWIGKPGFLSPGHLIDLRNRGHIIGSHSLSHPDPMSGLSYPRLLEQWQSSSEELGSILGERIRVAAVPGGGYSSMVAAAASEAGIDFLFTSEPTSHIHRVDGCTVIGRYAIRNSTEARVAAALATGDPFACSAQWAGWNTRTVAKKVLGIAYYRVRTRLLGASAKGQG
jgi:peptidoglycan/xylan/chitin deacetylase (PgdA/CDA1 family)